MSTSSKEPIVACPGYCCFDIGPIRSGDKHVTMEMMHELARDPAETGARFFVDHMLFSLGTDAKGREHFGCRLFDTETRRCTIYARRPKMCRNFPYGRACPICTYDDREPDVPGVLREEFQDPARLQAFVERIKT
jgi:Fe-S-cluster containining protein